MKKVVIIQRVLPHYRVGFFNLLKEELNAQNIDLTLIYGSPDKGESKKKDDVNLNWAVKIDNISINLFVTKLIWQPSLGYTKDADLVIVEQANKNLINYFLMIARIWSPRKLAFWGHGRNRQAGKSGIRNKIKEFYLNKCDWWFAYTDGVKKELADKGYPKDKITSVQNAIDTQTLRELYESISPPDLLNFISNEGIDFSNLAVYCGGLYKEKRVDFLLEACEAIREKVEDFQIVIIGGGPEQEKVASAANKHAWIHYVGPKFDREKAMYFKSAKFMMMPGLVGLGVLDSFTCETPIITTNYLFHSPEIEYLENGKNGLISNNSIDDYVSNVVNFLSDKVLQQKLTSGCLDSYKKYTLSTMASKFSNGIIKCLETV